MRQFWIIISAACMLVVLYWAVIMTKAVGNLYADVRALNQQVDKMTKENHHVGNTGQGEIQP